MFNIQAKHGLERTLQSLRGLTKRPSDAPQPLQQEKPGSRLAVALSDFRSLRMGRMHAQDDVLDYTAWLLAVAELNRPASEPRPSAELVFDRHRERVRRYGVSSTAIARRQLSTFPERLVPDDQGPPDLPKLFSRAGDAWQAPGLEERMAEFAKVSLACFEELYRDDETPPDDIIHVSCSGYLSPSPAQRYASKRGWCDTGILHSYHMGCYGAFPPVQIGLGLLASSHSTLPQPRTRVDIVHTELLSIHGDFANDDPGAIVNMTLFADGFVRYSLATTASLQQQGKAGLEILATSSRIIPDSADEMTWAPRSDVFEMYLSKAVPAKIRDSILPFVRDLCAQVGIAFEREKQDLYFAVHPGGPKILDHIAEALGIKERKLYWSRKVLFENGNMSSATIPHIWAELLEDPRVPRGARIVSMAFGPGLTATGMIFRKV